MTPISVPRRARRWARNPLLALTLVLGLLAGIVGLNAVAGAGTTLEPSGPGAIGADHLVRDAVVNVKVNPGGVVYKKANAAGNYNYLNLGLSSILDLLGCAGDNTAAAPGASGNRSPWTKVKVTGPNGFLVEWYSPSRDALAAPYAESNPQPAPNSGSSYRGAIPPTQGGTGFQIPVTLGDSGVYTVTTTTRNMVKTGLGACAVGTPKEGATPTGFTSATYAVGETVANGGTVIAGGLVEEVQTFEYRPWEQVFTDINGEGKVSFNVAPVAESQVQIGKAPNTVTGAIVPGGMRFYAVPNLGAFALPADPVGCATDPSSCLPSTAVECDPAQCDERLVIIQRTGAEQVWGIFDLETRAFIANIRIGSTGRVLFSLGTQLDPIYASLIPKLREAATSLGMDIEDLLGLGVSLSDGHTEGTLTLLNGLQINPATNPSGIHLLLNDVGAQAGLLMHVYAAITPYSLPQPAGFCQAVGSSADGVNYSRTSKVGYNVKKSDLLIDVPTAAGLDALGVGGRIWNIQGEFRGATPLAHISGALAGAEASTSVPLLDSDLLEVHYLLDAANTLTDPRVPKKMDFLGTAMWSATEADLSPLVGCLTIDFMVGVGVNLLNNPLPIGFGNLPLWDENPAAASLIATLNAAIASATGQVTGNPVVQDVLDQVLEAVGLNDILEEALP